MELASFLIDDCSLGCTLLEVIVDMRMAWRGQRNTSLSKPLLIQFGETYIDGLVQEKCNSIANVFLVLKKNPSIYGTKEK